MTNAQTKLIAATIVFGSGAVALAIGFLATATNSNTGEAGPIPGLIAMVAGLWLGVHALRNMSMQKDEPDE
ncbi:MAG: hypothetical protein ISS69_17195 [Phycisphaerae bacterium]|nr:hypothetical protein [Phycisphaerae bacterium]